MLPWLICGLLIFIAAALLLRLHFYRKSVDEIRTQLRESAPGDTNSTIKLSTADRTLRNLAADINVFLRDMRERRLRYDNGDNELRSAITNIAHDIRTPLTAISGYLELVEGNPAAVDRYLPVLRERTDALTALTEELFGYSVIASTADRLELSPVSLNRSLEIALAAAYGTLTARSIVPRISIPEENVVRGLDEKALQRVLGNILGNAARYSDGDLSVTLTGEGRIEISNSASSLTDVEVGRLFDRFYTVENARGATGLGLSIARLLTERMNGAISARLNGGRLCIAIEFIQSDHISA